MDELGRAPVRWEQRETDGETVRALSDALDLPEPLARVLVARGVEEESAARRFLSPKLAELPDPLRLAGVAAAVERLVAALNKGETIGIFGDYDVDGVTSTTVLWDFLESAGAEVCATLPDRLTEGYGLSRAGVDRLREAGAKLIVTVDCGVTAVDEVAYCDENGVDVIIIDHHTVPVELPRAWSVINPHQPDCESGAEHLCAVGVTFNLCMALRRHLRDAGWFTDARPEPDLRWALDLVALGTVADVVPLREDNRVFVTWGMKTIRQGRRVGMAALLDVAGSDPKRLSAGSLGFQVGPRINAAGRLGDAMQAVRLFRSPRMEEARELAARLDGENVSRRELERQIVEEAIAEVEASDEHREARVLVVGRESWHPGVVGIVASRLVDRFGKPAVVVGEAGRGSGRSIPKYHLYDALRSVEDTLEGFGGHAHAAGVRVPDGGLARFRDALCAQAEQVLEAEDLERLYRFDGDLLIDEIDLDLCRALARAAPFGRGNPEPTFRVRGVTARGLRELKGGHFKANVHPSRVVEAILFGAPERMAAFEDGPIDVLGTPEINEWRGNETVQLRLRDFRAGEQR